MDFPSIGDARQYFDVATACAHYFSGSGDPGATCYHPYRPIGIVLYYTIPLLFTDDPILASYITLFQNLLFFLLLIYAGLTLLQRFFSHATEALPADDVLSSPRIGNVVFVILTTLFSIGFISVRLSDHQSLALFLTAFCLLSADGLNPSKGKAFWAGILTGAAILMKQNFAVCAVFIVPLWLALVGRRDMKAALPPLICFCAGASLGFVQILWVYLHSVVPWLYDTGAMAIYDPSNRQPAVELAVYAGRPPADALAPIINYAHAEVTGIRIVFLLVALMSFASVASGQPWLAVLVITAFCLVSLNMAIAHVENRYFYLLRIVYVIYFVVLARQALAWWARRRPSVVPAVAG